MNSAFNLEMLILARESRGLTQAELAKALGLSQGEISKIETGIRIPDDEQVRRFAAFLRYKPELFFSTESVRGLGSGCVYHRKRQSSSDRALRCILANVNLHRMQVRRLLLAADLHTENRFVRLDVDEQGTPTDIARSLRVLWRLPSGPIQHLIREIENAGGIVMKCDFKTLKVDAVSQWVPSMPPICFVNADAPADRLRFTLAHEIGHITMHQIPTESMEKEADEFAAEFLMPAKEIKPHLFDVSLPHLAALKLHWKVSMAALLMRAGNLGTISARMRSYMWTQMGKHGYRKIEPVSIPPEEPTLLGELVELHRADLGYSVANLSDLLYLSDDNELRQMFLPKHQSGLRVIV